MRLFNEIELGGIPLKNSMVMAAMTRSRATIEGVVQDITVEYYVQRASAGLILTEAINISEDALGSPLTPGLYTQEQIVAWKKSDRCGPYPGRKNCSATLAYRTSWPFS